jgi:hypothetical protein
MKKTTGTPDDYNDRTTHLAKQASDVPAGWALVCCLALGIVLGFWHYPPVRFSPESLAREGVMLDPPGLRSGPQERTTLADDLGMTRRSAE